MSTIENNQQNSIRLQVFQDFYVLLVIRWIVYIYLFVKLSGIFFGYIKPTLKYRIKRKFQYVYGEQILRDLDHQDIQQLQITINNTIINATKNFTPNQISNNKIKHTKSLKLNQHKNISDQNQRTKFGLEQVSSNQLFQQQKSNKIKFVLQRNNYYQPVSRLPISNPNNIYQTNKQAILQIQVAQNIQQQNEEQKLSPKNNLNLSNKDFKKFETIDTNLIKENQEKQRDTHYSQSINQQQVNQHLQASDLIPLEDIQQGK